MCLFPKNENTLALRTIWATNFGLVPKTRNIYLEEKQSGIWWWVASSDERRRKQERETCTVTLGFFPGMDLEIWAWLAPGPISRRQKKWVVIALYFLWVFTTE